MTLRTATIVVGVIVCGCATARTDFEPYSPTSTRAPALERALPVNESDVPALAAAGAVIVGTVIVRGNGFAGEDWVREAAAVEAARHGGTHVVLGMTVQKSAHGQRLQLTGGAAPPGTMRATYYAGRGMELTALVLRLPDDASWSALPPALRARFDMQVAHNGARAAAPPAVAVVAAPESESDPESGSGSGSESESGPGFGSGSEPSASSTPTVQPLSADATDAATAEPVNIDGSHIKPLAPADDE